MIDWEMATLGDPLTDVALLLVYDGLATIAGGGAVADASARPGYPGPRTSWRRTPPRAVATSAPWTSTSGSPTSSSP